MEEGSPSEHHRKFTGVVGVVVPGLMWHIPCVVPSREANDPRPLLSPHSGSTRKVGLFIVVSTTRWFNDETCQLIKLQHKTSWAQHTIRATGHT